MEILKSHYISGQLDSCKSSKYIWNYIDPNKKERITYFGMNHLCKSDSFSQIFTNKLLFNYLCFKWMLFYV